ncbi:MAG: PAS domain S-box protein, partial [Tychonema bourrellyi B0820]|nr:PAS domain S-box protein [Tychonema bourrellyi B0820]
MFSRTTALTPTEQLRAAIVREPLVVSPDTTVIETIAQMSGVRSHCNTTRTADSQRDHLHLEARSSCVLVVENEQLVGVLTERDIVRLSAQQQPLHRLAMWEVMAHPVITLRQSAFTDLFFAINLLQQHHIRHLPILDEHDRLVGLVTHESLRQTSRPIDLLRLRLVSEVMTREVICAAPDCSLLAIAQLMAEHRVSSVMIVHPGRISTLMLQIPVGIVTERDIVQFQALGLNLETCLAEAVMSTPIFQVKPEESLWTVQQIMEQRSMRRLAVTGELGELLGIVTQTSLLQALNPLELYKLAQKWEEKVVCLEAEKVALLENRNLELERQVAERTLILKAKAHREQLLNTIAEQIRSSLNISDILDTTVQEIRSLLECDRVIIYEFRPDFSGTVIAEAITGTGRSVIHSEAHDPCISPEWLEPYRQGRIRIVNDIYGEAMTLCHQELLVGFDIRAKLMVPIVIEEQLWGLMLTSYRERPHLWTTDEIELVRQVSLQVAIALGQAMIHQKLQHELIKRQRIEATLIKSEERYAALAAAAPVGIFRTDTEGRCTYVNDRYFQISRLTPGATIGDAWQQRLHPDDRDWVIAQWGQFIQGNDSFELEYRFQRPDGEVTWVYGQCVPELDANGHRIGSIGTVTDISDRKRTEVRLQESEERYATLVEVSPVGIFRTDPGGNCIYVNDRWCQISGLTPKAAIGEGWRQGLHPEDRDSIALEWQQSAQQNRPFRLEYRFQRPDGAVAWVYGQSVAELDADGQVVGYVGAITDISDRKQAEQKLQQLNQELEAKVAERTQELWQVNSLQRAILNGADYSIISTDPTGIIQTFNAAAERMLGYDAQEIIGKVTPALIHDPNEVIEQAAILSAELKQEIPPGFEVFVAKARLGLISETEWTYIRKDGSRFPVSLSITALKDVNQQIIGFLGIAKDISDRKQAELERQQLIQELSAFKQALDQSAIVVITDPKGVITYANDRFCVVSGYSRNQLIGQTHRIVNSGYHPPSFFQNLWRTISGGQVWRGEICNRSKNGSLYWVASTIVPFLDEQGIPFQYLAIRFDITDRKLAEATLQHENTFRQQIVENMTEGLCVFYEVDEFPFLCFTVWNQQMQVITGYTLEEINRLGWYQSLYPDRWDQEWAIANLRQMQQGEYLAQEREIQRQDGIKRTIALSASILSSNDGLIYILALIQDITDRKQMEAQLAESEGKFRRLVEGGKDVIWSSDKDGIITYLSPQFKNVFGWEDSEWIGKPFIDLVHPDDLLFVHNDYEQNVNLSQKSSNSEFRHHHNNGNYIWVRTTITAIRNAEGVVISIQGVLSDITDRKEAEQIIQQQAERETLLREITQRIRQSLDLNTIFETATQEIRRFIQADRVGIFRFDPESGFDDGEFVSESVAPGFMSVLEIRVHDHCLGEQLSELYQQGRIQATNDIENTNLSDCHQAILSQFQVRANLILPLISGENLWGLLCIHQCSSPRQWQPKEINFTQEIANQLAIALQQANLYEQVQSELAIRKQTEKAIALQLKRQRTLGEITQQIRESLDIKQILATVTQQVKEILQGDRAIVFRLFVDGITQIVEESVFSDFQKLKNRHWENEVWSQEILEHYWQGKPRIVPDVMNDIWTDCLIEYSIEGQIQSKIVAPIVQEVRDSENHIWVAPEKTNKLWGLLVVHACREKRVWQESEAQLLQQIANQLAIAVQQASLFEQLQQQLTERQQAQQQLTERNQQLGASNEELARATRLKDEFLANMSHELRTPLNAIMGMSEGLQEQVFGIVNEKQIKALQTIERSGSHLLELINDILDVAKIESGQIELDCAPVSINHLCQSSLPFIKQQALQKRIQLEIKVPLNLPDLLIDERRMRQVLINLLNNAVKFTPNGG